MDESTSRSEAFTNLSIPQAYETYMAPQLFAPWARELIDFAGVQPGDAVLDIASGTGVVARGAAERVGETGHVIASDISGAMLARVGDHVTPVECAAENLAVPDSSQDVVLCQQGLQFFGDRNAALAEMYRVLRPGGTVAVSVWASEQPLGLFAPMMEALQGILPPPFPSAFDTASFGMTSTDLKKALETAGFSDVQVETQQVTGVWESMDDAFASIYGTFFGPPFAALSASEQDQIRLAFSESLRSGLRDGRVYIDTYANLARGTR